MLTEKEEHMKQLWELKYRRKARKARMKSMRKAAKAARRGDWEAREGGLLYGNAGQEYDDDDEVCLCVCVSLSAYDIRGFKARVSYV